MTEGATTISLDALQACTSQLQKLAAELHEQEQLRSQNAALVRPDESALRACDSSIKRNTALIKKIKALSAENEAAIIKECETVNQEKYVSEVASALAEAPKRPADTAPAIRLAALLHKRYAEFSTSFGQGLVRGFAAGTKATSVEEDRALAKKRRGIVRLTAEALMAGLLPTKDGVAALLAMLQDFATVKWEQDSEAFTRSLNLVSLFAKSPVRESILGEAPTVPSLPITQEQLEKGEKPEGFEDESAWQDLVSAWQGWRQACQEAWVLPQGDRAPLVKVVDRLYQVACTTLVADHTSLKTLEAENAKLLTSRGDLPAEVTAEYQRKRQAYEGLQRALTALSEALIRPMPDLPEDAFTRMDVEDGIKQIQPGSAADQAAAEGPWDDAETAAFYESLPDIKSLVPAVLLGLEKPAKKDGKEVSTTASETAATTDANETAQQANQPATTNSTETPATTEDAGKSNGRESAGGRISETGEAGLPKETDKDADEDGTGGGQAGRGQADALLQRLPTCVSKDLVDEVCVAWCFHNSKPARKRLIRALCDFPRGLGLQLVPFYARATAIFAQAFPDVPAGVITYLDAEFNALLAKKDSTQMSLEQRLRNARYIAELCKFRLYPAGSFFVALKSLLDDFSGLNVEAAITLIESAARFLLRQPETAVRMENMLEVMSRLKNVKHLDSRQAALVDGAYYAAKAPKGGFNAARRKKRPPLQAYIRHLIYEELSGNSLADVLKRLLKLPWATCERYVLKCMLKVVRGRVSNMSLVVSLAYALNQYYGSVGVALVDGVLEAIREGLESPGRGTYQKRVADVKLLGELYNYMVCDSVPVFEALYLLVTYGHEQPGLAAKIDPPTDFFRIRLVLALLDVCGRYFRKGKAGSRLDRFLTFFQVYCLSKAQPLPLDVEFDLEDVLHALRPNLARHSSYEEAAAALAALLAEEQQNGVGGVLGAIDEEDEEEEDERLAGGRRVEDDADGGKEVVAMDSDISRPGTDGGRTDDEEEEEEEIDEEFERELAALTGEAKPGKMPALASSQAAATDRAAEEQETPVVTLKLLMKKGGKDDRSKELQVPSATRIAAAITAGQAAEAQERQQLKQLVLAANKQQESEQAKAARMGAGRGAPRPHGRSGHDQRGGGGGRGQRAGHVPTSL